MRKKKKISGRGFLWLRSSETVMSFRRDIGAIDMVRLYSGTQARIEVALTKKRPVSRTHLVDGALATYLAMTQRNLHSFILKSSICFNDLGTWVQVRPSLVCCDERPIVLISSA